MKQHILALPFVLMACAPAPVEVVAPVTAGENSAGGSATPGLQERLPDTCGLDNYQGFIGQPVAAITYPAGDNVRVVQPGEILSQIYVADRVNLYVDEASVVQRIICG